MRISATLPPVPAPGVALPAAVLLAPACAAYLQRTYAYRPTCGGSRTRREWRPAPARSRKRPATLNRARNAFTTLGPATMDSTSKLASDLDFLCWYCAREHKADCGPVAWRRQPLPLACETVRRAVGRPQIRERNRQLPSLRGVLSGEAQRIRSALCSSFSSVSSLCIKHFIRSR